MLYTNILNHTRIFTIYDDVEPVVELHNLYPILNSIHLYLQIIIYIILYNENTSNLELSDSATIEKNKHHLTIFWLISLHNYKLFASER